MTLRTILAAALALACSGELLAQFTVTGVFEYEDKGWGYNGWTGNDPSKPIRRADVTVLDDVTDIALGTGSTDATGAFSIVCTGAGTTDIVVRVNADTGLDSFQRIRVTTESNTEYSAFSPVFPSHDTSTDLDVGTTTVLKIFSGSNEANAFNLLDMGVDAWEYITGPAGASSVGTTIRVFWPSGSGSFATGNEAHMANDDGYDDAVILHEIGHVVHNQYSDSDSPGGSHFFGDSDQDPRLSLGEGYATFFAGCVFDAQLDRQAIYQDANGSSQNGGSQLRMRLETAEPYANDSRGAADEVAVACTLFDIIDTEDSNDQSQGNDDDDIGTTTLVDGKTPHVAWWDAFSGPVATAANLTINDCWNGWFSEHGINGLHTEMEDLFGNRRMDFFNDVDEPNDTIDTPVPVSLSNAWSSNRTLYASVDSPPVPGVGDRDWYSFDVVIGSRVTIETRYPNGAGDADTQCDTELRFFDTTDTNRITDNSSGTGRNAKIEDFLIDQTGTWKTRVRTSSTFREYGRYNYRVSYEFENFVPTIDVGPTATPSTITDAETSTLSVTASDANGGQVLSYAWTPLSGGTIIGSGASVTFMPPIVGAPTDFDIELVVTDDLGAESEPAIVTVTVDNGAGSPCVNPAESNNGGVGKAGQNGIPVLTGDNLPVVPSGDYAIRLSNALPGAPCSIILGLSLISVPFDLGTFYPSPDIILPAVVDPLGEIVLPLPLANEPGVCGLTLYWQIMVPNDPGAIGAKQTSQTNYVEMVFGG